MGGLDFMLRRVLWPLALAGVTFVACLFIVHDRRIALYVAAVPLLLGVLGFVRVASAVTAAAGIVAVGLSVTTPGQRAELMAQGDGMMHGAANRLNSVVEGESARANTTARTARRPTSDPPTPSEHSRRRDG